MAFRVGERVICVDDAADTGSRWDGDSPIKGEHYTIRRYWVDDEGTPRVYLNEICRSARAVAYWGGEDCGYRAERFRPLIERKTDTGMAILRKLLDGNKIEEKV